MIMYFIMQFLPDIYDKIQSLRCVLLYFLHMNLKCIDHKQNLNRNDLRDCSEWEFRN